MTATATKRKKRRAPHERAVLTPPEVALEFGVTEAKVHAWIRGGVLRAFNISADTATKRPRLGITRDAVNDFIAARSTAPTPKPARTRRANTNGVTRYF